MAKAKSNTTPDGFIKLQIAPGEAKPSPPVGPILGQRGLNIMEFCKAFNDKTKGMDKDLVVPVVLVYYQDKSFTFEIKQPKASALLLKKIGISKGSAEPNKTKVGKITRQELEEVAKIKQPDLSSYDVDQAVKILAGTARSMGIDVEW